MGKENFQYWKELVGLEETEFPQLVPLTDDNIGRASIVPTRLLEIKRAIASNNIVNVQVYPGWGATTLYQYLKHDLDKDTLTLLVSFDFEKDVLDGSLTEEEFAFRTKWKMAHGICEMMRGNSMPQIYMYEVLGFEDTGSSPWAGHLRKKMRALGDCEDNASKFYAEFPFFSKIPLDVCVNYFLKNFQIRTVFLYLFPRRVPEDYLVEFVGIIKNIYDGKEIEPAAMREVYVATSKTFNQMSNVYNPSSLTITYKRYSAGEMFSMLVSAYYNADGAFVSVNDVLDEEFISRAYNEKLTMTKIMEKVAQAIEESLEGNTADIPYKLTCASKH